MNNITSNVKRIREKKGYPQDYMAVEMGISQSKYSRMESGEAPLTIDDLQQIADLLKTDIAEFLDTSKITIQNQTNNEGAYGNGYVENLNIENKETNRQLIQAKDETIQQLKDENEHLKSEIDFLRSIIKKEMSTKELFT